MDDTGSKEGFFCGLGYAFFVQERTKIGSLRSKRFRLRVVSNFGDGDCGAGEIHTRARARNLEATRRAPFVSRRLEISRARVCISPAPQSPSPKLETTRSLQAFR